MTDQPTGQPVTRETTITYWDEIDPADTHNQNFWISDAMKSAVGVWLFKQPADVPLSDISLRVDRDRGVIILTETPVTETPVTDSTDASEVEDQPMASDDENLTQHTEHARRRAAQVLGLPDPQGPWETCNASNFGRQ